MNKRICDVQAERKAAEVWYGPWDDIREAIITARGGNEAALDIARTDDEPIEVGW